MYLRLFVMTLSSNFFPPPVPSPSFYSIVTDYVLVLFFSFVFPPSHVLFNFLSRQINTYKSPSNQKTLYNHPKSLVHAAGLGRPKIRASGGLFIVIYSQQQQNFNAIRVATATLCSCSSLSLLFMRIVIRVNSGAIYSLMLSSSSRCYLLCRG